MAHSTVGSGLCEGERRTDHRFFAMAQCARDDDGDGRLIPSTLAHRHASTVKKGPRRHLGEIERKCAQAGATCGSATLAGRFEPNEGEHARHNLAKLSLKISVLISRKQLRSATRHERGVAGSVGGREVCLSIIWQLEGDDGTSSKDKSGVGI